MDAALFNQIAVIEWGISIVVFEAVCSFAYYKSKDFNGPVSKRVIIFNMVNMLLYTASVLGNRAFDDVTIKLISHVIISVTVIGSYINWVYFF